MIKQLIFGAGFLFLLAIPAAAQTGATEKNHPLEVRNDENPQYREQHKTRDYTGISKDPKYKTTGAATTNSSSTSRPPVKVADSASAAPPAPKAAEKPKQD